MQPQALNLKFVLTMWSHENEKKIRTQMQPKAERKYMDITAGGHKKMSTCAHGEKKLRECTPSQKINA